MGQFSALSKKQSSETCIRDYNHGAQPRSQGLFPGLGNEVAWCYYRDLYGINKVLLLLNEDEDPSFLFPNLSSYNIDNQFSKFEENLSVGSISVE